MITFCFKNVAISGKPHKMHVDYCSISKKKIIIIYLTFAFPFFNANIYVRLTMQNCFVILFLYHKQISLSFSITNYEDASQQPMYPSGISLKVDKHEKSHLKRNTKGQRLQNILSSPSFLTPNLENNYLNLLFIYIWFSYNTGSRGQQHPSHDQWRNSEIVHCRTKGPFLPP